MTKLLFWRNEWSLSIEPLDTDHRVLVERLSDLVLRFCPEASVSRAGRADALILGLTELGEIARAHFQRAEAFMEMLGYEGVAAHQAEDALMMAEYTALLREWREEGLEVFDEEAQTIVREWLLAHILGTDRDFAAYYFQLCGQEAETSRKGGESAPRAGQHPARPWSVGGAACSAGEGGPD